MNNLDQLVNIRVSITTILEQVISGYIISWSPTHDVLVLNTWFDKKTLNNNIRFINTAFIKSIEVSNRKNTFNNHRPQLQVANIDIKRLEKDINHSIEEFRKDRLIHNPKSNDVGAKVFEKLLDVYNIDSVKWDESDIVLLDEVKIAKPYKLQNITKLNDKTKATIQVEKILKELKIQ